MSGSPVCHSIHTLYGPATRLSPRTLATGRSAGQPTDSRLLVEGSAARIALPDWHELTAAFCGHIGEEPGDHPVTRAALALALLHNARRSAPEYSTVIDCGRTELIADIDEWIDRNVSSSGGVEPVLGAAIDQMAAAQICANHLLLTVEDVSDEKVHKAWFELALLTTQWSDLVTEVLYGQSRLMIESRGSLCRNTATSR